MTARVDQIWDLRRRMAAAQTPRDKEMLQRQIAATNQSRRVGNRLVYELYELTEEEIGIVEGR
ncbi:MAG: hypothetical protein GW893_18725 [Armatimonadetes bacterium]|nr:hypothetical protein [Armatimonadota bacterium]PIU60911.1 MAG: hypothetical protein COS85_22290 [Armatimonadetes bacterium CG07_land_8_20_14_0_80_59_28]PIY44593.1 MAG: hypothetical protein COZ05_07790 [Armatimonadetes bacterium CG_4_10_14_3_um_filter_59_10]PJB63315.1 MAG: hypothetical protein CO095_16715 [Armatimonadetes bacterium CG_4_9_14_3_um_filter_58_7]